MKQLRFSSNLSRHLSSLSAALISISLGIAYAQPAILTNQHADIGVAFENGEFEPHVHDETNDTEYAPGDAVLQVGPASASLVPADSRFSFLGTAGSRIYVLPQIQNPSLLFLGLAAEEIETGVFTEDRIRLDLKRVQGPGDFFLYSTSGVLGNPSVSYNSRDGISAADSAVLLAGGHTDFNWAFSQPGDYKLTVEASGTLVDGGQLLRSAEVDFHFQVIPEPGTWAIFATGSAIGMMFWARRRNRS